MQEAATASRNLVFSPQFTPHLTTVKSDTN